MTDPVKKQQKRKAKDSPPSKAVMVGDDKAKSSAV